MADIAIQVQDLSKCYQLGLQQERHDTLRDALTGALRRIKPGERQKTTATSTLWAIKDLSFTIQRGEAVGIIGRNGAGKSTLLKILSQITEPTSGRAVINGRVGSLLEVGTGFHPELTGRENIFLYGAVLGMHRKEIERKYDEIVAFAEIERFLDTPVKRYSSGMYVRLAFAVAAHLEPEILLVDEVLAVGDASFQKKCLGRMGDVSHGGRTVLFVSHQMNAIRELCENCIWLDAGNIIDFGPSNTIIANYLKFNLNNHQWSADEDERIQKNSVFNPKSFYAINQNMELIQGSIRADEPIGIVIEGEVIKVDPALSVGFAVFASNGELLFWSLQTDVEEHQWPELIVGSNKLVAWLPINFLNEGDYRIELNISIHYKEWIFKPGVNSPSIGLVIRGGLSNSPHWINARPGLMAPIIPFNKLA